MFISFVTLSFIILFKKNSSPLSSKCSFPHQILQVASVSDLNENEKDSESHSPEGNSCSQNYLFT